MLSIVIHDRSFVLCFTNGLLGFRKQFCHRHLEPLEYTFTQPGQYWIMVTATDTSGNTCVGNPSMFPSYVGLPTNWSYCGLTSFVTMNVTGSGQSKRVIEPARREAEDRKARGIVTQTPARPTPLPWGRRFPTTLPKP